MTIDGKENGMNLFRGLEIGTPFILGDKFYFKTDEDKARYFLEQIRFDFDLATRMEDFTKEVTIDANMQVTQMLKAQVHFGVNM